VGLSDRQGAVPVDPVKATSNFPREMKTRINDERPLPSVRSLHD
jgi:hypothetical protein